MRLLRLVALSGHDVCGAGSGTWKPRVHDTQLLERRGLGAVDAQRGGDGGPRGVPPPIQQEQAVAHLPQAKRAQSCGPWVV